MDRILKKILVVDDSVEMLELMTELLSENYDVTTRSSYEEVVSLASQQLSFDVILLDVNLGEDQKSGFDIFEWLSQKKFQGRIIFFTGHARSYPILQNYLKSPNVQLIEKPPELKQL